MKKLNVLLSAIATTLGMSVFAQTEDFREELKLGIKGGLNSSNVWDEQDQNFEADNAFGFAGGAYLQIPLGKYLGIQPEVLYSQKGFQGSGTVLGQPYAFKRTTNYLDVPILITLKPSPFFTIVAGPQYSYLLSQQDDFTSGPYTSSDFREFDNNNIRKNTFGALVGFDINANHLVISPRAGWDLQTNRGDGTSETPRYKNQWFQLTLGYRF